MTSSALSDIMRWGKIIGTNMFSFFLNPFGLNILVFFSAFNCLDYLNVPKNLFYFASGDKMVSCKLHELLMKCMGQEVIPGKWVLWVQVSVLHSD